MGHGASTSVKKLTIQQNINGQPRKTARQEDESVSECRPSSPAKLGWTRSSSDGCIVENLNSSKTKIELLEQQVKEFKELFQHAEQEVDEAQQRAKMLELQMAEVEGTNFDLMDRVTELEQRLEESRSHALPDDKEYSRSLEDQDQIILKQEQQIKSLEEELSKMRTKLKKRLRSTQTELAETKQEAGLKMYSLKDQISSLQEENTRLVERLDRAHSLSSAHGHRSMPCSATLDSHTVGGASEREDSGEEWEDSRTKLILELSSRLSAQEQRLCEFEDAVREKDILIRSLQQQTAQSRRPSGSLRKKRSSHETEIYVDLSNHSAGDDNDVVLSSSERRHRKSSSESRDHRQISSAQISIPSKTQGQNSCRPKETDAESLRSLERLEESAGRNSDRILRQPSANGLDSEINDSNSTKSSSASSSRYRRRLKNQFSRQCSADKRGSRTETTSVESNSWTAGRDSGIGITESIAGL